MFSEQVWTQIWTIAGVAAGGVIGWASAWHIARQQRKADSAQRLREAYASWFAAIQIELRARLALVVAGGISADYSRQLFALGEAGTEVIRMRNMLLMLETIAPNRAKMSRILASLEQAVRITDLEEFQTAAMAIDAMLREFADELREHHPMLQV